MTDHRPAQPLRTDGLDRPLGLTEGTPLLSFIRSAPVLTRVVARGSSGQRWSAEIRPEEAPIVEWSGWALTSRERVEWWVEPAGEESVPRETTWFEMGLLEDDDWDAKWISHPEPTTLPTEDGVSGARYFLREFHVEAPVHTARLYISGPGFHRVSLTRATAKPDRTVNGSPRPLSALLEPGFTRYDKRVLYVTHDVTNELRACEGSQAALGICIANGWYNEELQTAWGFESAPWRGEPTLLYQLEIQYADGERSAYWSDERTVAGSGPLTSAGLRTGITVDLRVPTRVDRPAQVVGGPQGRLCGQLYPPIRVGESIHPISTHRTARSSRVFDFGQNLAGGARLILDRELTERLKVGRSESEGKTRIVLRYGERLDDRGAVSQANIGKLVESERFQEDRLVLGTDEQVEFQTELTYHGFRYVEAHPDPGAGAVLAQRFSMDFDRVGNFRCSDERINTLVLLSERAYLSNFHSIPTDCPHREKNGWTADAHLACAFGLYTYRAESAYRKWLSDFLDEQRESGALPGIIPTSGWGYDWGNGPVWDAAYAIVSWRLYQMRGDRRTAARHLPGLMRYIYHINGRRTESRSSNGLVQFGLGDWVPPYGAHDEYVCPTELLSTAFFFYIVTLTGRLASAIGHNDTAETCGRLARELRSVFLSEFFDPENGGCGPNDITSLSLPILLGLIEGEYMIRTGARLVDVVAQAGYHFECGVVGSSAVLHALSRVGRKDVAWKMITAAGFPGYMDWIDRGATTLWETWQGSDSLNHVFFADVVAWLYEHVAGISFEAGRVVQSEPWIPPGVAWISADHSGTHKAVTVRAERP